MSVKIDANEKFISIHTKSTTYQMMVDELGCLIHLYYGRRTNGNLDYLLTWHDRGFSGNPYASGNDRTYSLDFLPQEFPAYGTGDYRSPALIVRDASGVYDADLRYVSSKVSSGKYSLPGLPAVYAEAKEAETLSVLLRDDRLGLEVTLLYGIIPELDIITRSVKVRNEGSQNLHIEKLQSACLDFMTGKYDLTVFHGRHAMERMPERQALLHRSVSFGSRRGYSSHEYNPFLILSDTDTTETAGRCWSMQFVYSGGFLSEAETDQYGQTRVQMGLEQDCFEYDLKPGTELYGPEVIMSFSGCGFGPLSYNLHKCIREHVCRGYYRDRSRPVLINSWEAFMFDFTGEQLLEFAEQSAELGVDMLVLDDGWFGARNDDCCGLGDWTVNEEKLGCTLSELIKKVNALGLDFGIWVEPEMVNEKSRLYKEHPDWALTIPGKAPVRSRNQLVLDFSRKEVVDAIFDAICKVLDQGPVKYIKWDCNRSIADVHSAVGDQGSVLYNYMLGLYDFLERLNKRYPEMLIEGCSGGGGRFDAGMLYYCPQIWCSDNTDAVDRLRIQYGTSFGYPVSTMGAHVSICPNQQNGRVTPLESRAATAMAGTFGYELDPKDLTEQEKDQIREQIKTFKKNEMLIRNGRYFRLADPFKEDYSAWEFLAEDGSELQVTVVWQNHHGSVGNSPIAFVRLQGLEPNVIYKDTDTGTVYDGAAIMEYGIPVTGISKDYETWQLHLIRIEE